MACVIGRTLGRATGIKRDSAAPHQRSRVVPRRAAVVSFTSKEDAVKQLEEFGARTLAHVENTTVSSIPVTPLAAKSIDSSLSGSIDGGLLELTKDTFWEYLKLQGDNLVVVDFYTDWCGPCKLIYPELVKLSHELTDVRFVKFNCNKSNKDLGMKLGIKVAPTFQFYRNSEKIAEMTGAKMDKLRTLIEEVQQQQAASNN